MLYVRLSLNKVTVLSPHPGSELCSADFDKYLPWSLGLLLSISVWITISTPWGVYSRSHVTWRHGLQIYPHRYPFPPWSREAMQREVPCSGAQRAVAPTGYWSQDLTALYRWTNSSLHSLIWNLLVLCIKNHITLVNHVNLTDTLLCSVVVEQN